MAAEDVAYGRRVSLHPGIHVDTSVTLYPPRAWAVCSSGVKSSSPAPSPATDATDRQLCRARPSARGAGAESDEDHRPQHTHDARRDTNGTGAETLTRTGDIESGTTPWIVKALATGPSSPVEADAPRLMRGHTEGQWEYGHWLESGMTSSDCTCDQCQRQNR